MSVNINCNLILNTKPKFDQRLTDISLLLFNIDIEVLTQIHTHKNKIEWDQLGFLLTVSYKAIISILIGIITSGELIFLYCKYFSYISFFKNCDCLVSIL